MKTLCGMNLPTVGMVIGWFNVITASLSSIIFIIGLIHLDYITDMCVKALEGSTETSMRFVVVIGLSICLTASLANLIASALLIVGILKERHLLLTPWLFNTYVVITIQLMYMLLMWGGRSVTIESCLIATIITGFALVVQITIWNAIYSLFKQIRVNCEQQVCLLTSGRSSPNGNIDYGNYIKMQKCLML